ncbi:MAG: glutamate 5-kinase [Candidatus Pelagibacterales bacterium]|nr:MAG: glutamate 5-kinase [Pelagibacterales bacterium]
MYINKFKKIVIKIGSSTLVDKKGKTKKKWFKEFAKDIKNLINKKKQIVIVSSGAIAMGCEYLKIKKSGLKVDKSQAVASVGQIELMDFYKKNFNKYKIKISQILLTLDDTEQRRRSINARRTIENLLSMGIVPIVNENDTTATSEIKYGDNDRLAARVSQIISADCLILLSDVDGLYTDNPKKNKKIKLIKTVKNIDENIKKYATRTENLYGSGGMKTKIEAAKICQLSGCYMVIANGKHNNPIKEIIKNKRCTWFIPKVSKLDARKQWIIGSISPKGEVIIDQGALKALKNGKSLLPAGVKKINGKFEKGDHILVKDDNNIECARGLTSFSSVEIEKIKGSHSSKIKNILGYSSRDEIIHKDDLVKV